MEAGPLPVVDRHTGCHHKSILIRKYRPVGGTAFSKPPADDLVPIQVQRNLLETLWFMCLMHHSAPMVFLPAGVTLEDELTGIPGGVYRFRAHDPAQKPFVQQGFSPPEALLKGLQQLDQDGEAVSGLNSVLTGGRPEGDPTLGEVQILQERGMAAFRVPLEEYVDFRTQQAQLLLMLARESAWSPRFRKAMGENGQWQVDTFSAVELAGAVDITIDPLSRVAEIAAHAADAAGESRGNGRAATGAGPGSGAASPDELVARGLQEVARITTACRLRANWIAGKRRSSPLEILPPVMQAITPAIHLHFKKEFLKTEEAEQLAAANPPVWQAMVQHIAQLEQAMAPPMPPPPGPGQKGGPPPDGSAIDKAVQGGQMQPAGKPQRPDGTGHVARGSFSRPRRHRARRRARWIRCSSGARCSRPGRKGPPGPRWTN